MNILFCGGGTAGHINPSLAIAEELRKKSNVNIGFVGRYGGDENRLITNDGYKLYTVKLTGLKKSPIAAIKSLFLAYRATHECQKIIKEFSPDIIFGTGGYVSYPLIKAGLKLKIPCILHESNAMPGLVTRLLGKKCTYLLLTAPDNKYKLHLSPCAKIVGTPIRKAFDSYSKKQARQILGIENDDFFVLSSGGSLGAEKLNNAVLGTMEKVVKAKLKIRQIHSTGKRNYDSLAKIYPNFTEESTYQRIIPYIENMPLYLTAADLVISRCGAVSLAEIENGKKDAILIPSPNVKDNHQLINAKSIKERLDVEIIEECNLTSEVLFEKIKSFYMNKLHKKNNNTVKSNRQNNPRNTICKLILELILK